MCDSDDPCPDDATDDADGDGVCDAWDVCPGLDDDLDDDGDGEPDGCVCEDPDVDLLPAIPDIEEFTSWGLALEAIVDADGRFRDFVDVDGPRSATLRAVLYDGLQPSCSIAWDLTEFGLAAPSTSAWTRAAPVPLYAAWDLELRNFETDCEGPIVSDFIVRMQKYPIGIGIGPMHGLDDLLRLDPAVDAAWETDWEPYVASLYDSTAPHEAELPAEVSYVLQYDRTCDTLKVDPRTLERALLPKPDGAPLLEFYEAVARRLY